MDKVPPRLVLAYPDEHAPPGLQLPAGVVVVGSPHDRERLGWAPWYDGHPLYSAGRSPWVTLHLWGCAGHEHQVARVIPLSEEAVLPAAHAGEWLSTALLVTARGPLRRTLPRDLCPVWGWTPWAMATMLRSVVKAPASTLGRGVVHLRNASDFGASVVLATMGAREEVARLQAYGGDLSPVVEEWVPGPQLEITGVVAEPGDAHWWDALEQTWEGDQVVRYEPAGQRASWDLAAIGERVVRALGLAWCWVCIEARRAEHGWVVIDVHCRPGDDDPAKGYPLLEYLQEGVAFLADRAT